MKQIKDNDLDLLDGLPKARENVFRERRDNSKTGLMAALDKYEKNVLRGRVLETPEEKCKIDKWYQSLLDLDEEAFYNVPEKVKKYLKE